MYTIYTVYVYMWIWCMHAHVHVHVHVHYASPCSSTLYNAMYMYHICICTAHPAMMTVLLGNPFLHRTGAGCLHSMMNWSSSAAPPPLGVGDGSSGQGPVLAHPQAQRQVGWVTHVCQVYCYSVQYMSHESVTCSST